MGKRGRRSDRSGRRRRELKRLRDEAYYDRERAETISLHDYPTIDIRRGEVCHDARGYLHPNLDTDRGWRKRVLAAQRLGAKIHELDAEVGVQAQTAVTKARLAIARPTTSRP